MNKKTILVAEDEISEDRENAKSVGFDYYLSKPIVRDLFMEVMGKYLN